MTYSATINELVFANRVLDFENVLDGYGHISVRHPEKTDRFLLSHSKSAAVIEYDDILEFGLDGQPIARDTRPLYLERFIHAGIYAARPEVRAVVHSHAEDILPFSVSDVALRPLIHSASGMGGPAPVWDIHTRFGDTDLLVSNMDQATDLAEALGSGSVILMRGHGFVVAATSLLEAVRLSTYIPKNARVQTAGLALGGKLTFLSQGEIQARTFNAANPSAAAAYDPSGPAMQRGWEYWRHKTQQHTCGCHENKNAVKKNSPTEG